MAITTIATAITVAAMESNIKSSNQLAFERER